MRISDWSSDVCSSDLRRAGAGVPVTVGSLTASAPRAELGLEGRDLLDAEAANTAATSDAQPLHQLAGPDLAQAGHRLPQDDHLHPANHLIGLALSEHVHVRGPGICPPILSRSVVPPGRGALSHVALKR